MSYRERKLERNPNFNLIPFRAGKRPYGRDQIQPERHSVRERPTRETQLHHNPQRSKAQGPEKANREQWSRRQRHPSYGYGKGVLEKAIPFLFTNFPEDWEMGEITLQDKFAMEGYFSAQVTPMGVNLVLLSSGDEEELKHLVDEGREWPAQWFTNVRPWTPEEMATERFTWLRCQGVPLHIWKRSVKKLEWTTYFHSVQISLYVEMMIPVQKVGLKDPTGGSGIFITGEEFENVLETLDSTKNTINAGRLLSNQQRGEGLEENIMIEQWGVEPRGNRSLKQQTDGEDEGKISNEDTYPPGFGPKWRELGFITNLGPTDWTECSHLVEQQKAMAQNQEVDKGEEKVPNGKSTQKGASDKGNKDSTCSAKPASTGKAESNDDDSIEKERRTQPFWEGLASDNEILQSKVERLAKQRKMEKKKLKLRKVTTRRKIQLKQKSDLKGRNKKCTSEVEPQKFTIEVESRSRGGANRANTGADLNLKDEAEELWNIGKQLGLVEKNNSAEIIKKLSEMEKQDKTTLAKQRLANAEKKGVQPVNP
ncbi:hypothetical protein SLEP1_g50625 [Rubroshorea leprosula]|uniref:DUF4283 domain-containing protein n=1 Tax=Rubroshorea leprosula TaxID=152421 RepID=A0AAV5M0W6_9ROSI|nr:hypothetical protein SLEP1_g50625 [Rubroshorea leprosula]